MKFTFHSRNLSTGSYSVRKYLSRNVQITSHGLGVMQTCPTSSESLVELLWGQMWDADQGRPSDHDRVSVMDSTLCYHSWRRPRKGRDIYAYRICSRKSQRPWLKLREEAAQVDVLIRVDFYCPLRGGFPHPDGAQVSQVLSGRGKSSSRHTSPLLPGQISGASALWGPIVLVSA